jgi:recombinational DNA repair protein (RecF pathway)
MKVDVLLAKGNKCARCWKVLPEVGLSVEHPALCMRCLHAITGEEPNMIALATARWERFYAAARAEGADHPEAVSLANSRNRHGA